MKPTIPMNPLQVIFDALAQTERAYQTKFGSRRQNADWANWYASFLIQETDFGQATQRRWQVQELAEALSDLNTTFEQTLRKQSWAEFLAGRLSS